MHVFLSTPSSLLLISQAYLTTKPVSHGTNYGSERGKTASGPGALWVEPCSLCLFSSVFPAWNQPTLVWGVVTGTCCLPTMLLCQLIASLSYCLGTGYTAGTPYKVPPTQSNTAPPPYSPSPNPYQTAMYPIRSAYPQQNLYAQGAYYTQPVYAAQPHVIHHTTVVQPNSIPSAIYPAPVAAPRTNGVAMGMVAGTTMAMSAGTLLTAPQHTAIGAHPVSMPTYRAQGTPAYSYVPPHW
uniref:Family with sequence similarity 168 member A n=1 Tax=Ursus americanus TaxID=9643 RepID=A0A452QPL6_URSAM